VEEHLKQLMHRLGHAINESLSESEAIAEAIGEIRREGHDVYLVLEATIGLSKRETPESGDDAGFSEQDQAFLKALKIAVDE
jgi:hypothetical protein